MMSEAFCPNLGLSIPVGAFIGSSLGFASGGVVGGSAGVAWREGALRSATGGKPSP